jgi:hypothetical protein
MDEDLQAFAAHELGGLRKKRQGFIDSTTGREYATIVWNDSDQITYTAKWLELKCPQKVLVIHLFSRAR